MFLMPTLQSTLSIDLTHRPRRNRRSESIRRLTQETHFQPSQLVAPLFVLDGNNEEQEVHSMPGVKRQSIDLLMKEIEFLVELGVGAVDLFPIVPDEIKNREGSESHNPEGLMQRATRAIKTAFPELCVMVDVALDPFTDYGHDGLIDDEGKILNDPTLEALAQMSVSCAEAGADMIAPSDMMDGRVAYIRKALDQGGFQDVGILSYTAKYASAFYGPFRDALNSAPRFGDKKSYQMNPANIREAILEATLDESEGADLLMVKPALPYLDVIAKLKEVTPLPIGAYHVSGEYAMIMAATQNGWIDGDKVLYESLLSIKRAGADFIFTYGAKQAIQHHNKIH